MNTAAELTGMHMRTLDREKAGKLYLKVHERCRFVSERQPNIW